MIGNPHEPQLIASAGSTLLSKYQDQWKQIHSNGEINLSKVKIALTKLSDLDRRVTNRLEALNDLLSSYKSLSRLEDQIKSIDGDLKALESCFGKIEDFLTLLRNQREKIATKQIKAMLEAEFQTKASELRIQSELRKEELKRNHFRCLDEIEQEEQRILEERRQILQQAFEEEKKLYMQGAKGSEQM